jgi:hypothetical protein
MFGRGGESSGYGCVAGGRGGSIPYLRVVGRRRQEADFQETDMDDRYALAVIAPELVS